MNWNEFWLKTVMVRCSDDQMDFWLGCQQKYVFWSTRCVWGQVMCGLGVLVGLVEGRLSRGVETKVVGSYIPIRPQKRMRYVVECRL